jgi:uncharacterized protein YyaL (SSP411 family)
MTNKLAGENSPYLLQHANNPVEWYPWGSEALEKARREDKPIFLSIGYAACHWCHVMEHESFEDPNTARLMNEHFINIKVDREERPDLDGIYMNAVVALTGQGGWPMSVFLTPDGEPFWGGTYFPPVRRYNMPAFPEILLTVARLWADDREKLLQSGQEISEHLKSASQMPSSQATLNLGQLTQASQVLAQAYDWKNGGWGGAPKFPQPMSIEFALRQAARGDEVARDMAIHALNAMARGGMYDVVGGGFARYSTDDVWLVPHFEKMLYDNAQLAQVYLLGFMLSGKAGLKRVCEQTLDFVLRELAHPLGGFYSSLDADSEGEEGKYYVWTPQEIQATLQDQADVEFFSAAYATSQTGNFEGKNVLQRALNNAQLAERFGTQPEAAQARLNHLHSLLLAEREKRVRPNTDDKVLVSWNALMLAAFAEAARYLKRPDYGQAAARNADFLLTQLHPGDRLLRSWREGQARHNAYLEDYAALILGLLALYQTDPNPRWYQWAARLTEELLENFRDPSGGFFDTRLDHETLFTRPRDLQDNATPSGNALAASALLQMSAYSGRGDWRDMAEDGLRAMTATATRYPTAFARWLSALDFALGPQVEVAILGKADDPHTQALLDTLWSGYRPRLVVAQSDYPPPAASPPLLDDRRLLQERPTAYVCQNFLCHQPVNDPTQLLAQLDSNTQASQ